MKKENGMRYSIIGVTIIFLTLFIFIIGYLTYPILEIFIDSRKLPCDQLPTVEQVETVLLQHNDTRAQVEKFTSGRIQVDTNRCPGKADLLIYYETVYDRINIKKMIGDSFFGMPYRMFNV